MKNHQKLSREELKAIKGGIIPPGDVWIICSTDNGNVQELSACDPCAHCSGNGGFVSFVQGYSCPSCD
jgi:hypothetical protein